MELVGLMVIMVIMVMIVYSLGSGYSDRPQARLVDAVASDDSDVLVFGARGMPESSGEALGTSGECLVNG